MASKSAERYKGYCLLKTYEEKKHSKLYQAAMDDDNARANWAAMMEVKGNMCEALRELMEDEFQAYGKQVTEQVTEQVTTEQVTVQMIKMHMKV